jgi:hypothetical protein
VIGGTASCVFQPANIGIGLIEAHPSGTPATWVVISQNDMSGGQIFYHCGADR